MAQANAIASTSSVLRHFCTCVYVCTSSTSCTITTYLSSFSIVFFLPSSTSCAITSYLSSLSIFYVSLLVPSVPLRRICLPSLSSTSHFFYHLCHCLIYVFPLHLLRLTSSTIYAIATYLSSLSIFYISLLLPYVPLPHICLPSPYSTSDFFYHLCHCLMSVFPLHLLCLTSSTICTIASYLSPLSILDVSHLLPSVPLPPICLPSLSSTSPFFHQLYYCHLSVFILYLLFLPSSTSCAIPSSVFPLRLLHLTSSAICTIATYQSFFYFSLLPPAVPLPHICLTSPSSMSHFFYHLYHCHLPVFPLHLLCLTSSTICTIATYLSSFYIFLLYNLFLPSSTSYTIPSSVLLSIFYASLLLPSVPLPPISLPSPFLRLNSSAICSIATYLSSLSICYFSFLPPAVPFPHLSSLSIFYISLLPPAVLLPPICLPSLSSTSHFFQLRSNYLSLLFSVFLYVSLSSGGDGGDKWSIALISCYLLHSNQAHYVSSSSSAMATFKPAISLFL